MFDVDGDTLLVVREPDVVRIAQDNTKDVVPLYYDMSKSVVEELNNENIYKGLVLAFVGGNIGGISNDITKVWDKPIEKEMTQEDLDSIKIMCALTNFTIDYAKTLYKPEIPLHITQMLKKYSNKKVPHFFIYAKDKHKSQVSKKNTSPINLICSEFLTRKISYKKFKLKEFNYFKLLNDENVVTKIELQPDKYVDFFEKVKKINNTYRFKLNGGIISDDIKESIYDEAMNQVTQSIVEAGKQYDLNSDELLDLLVYYFYGRENCRSKAVLWSCFGKSLLERLEKAQNKEISICQFCGAEFKSKNNNKYCSDECLNNSKYVPIKTKKILCVDCETEFEVDARNMKKIRCDDCQKEFRRKYDRERKKFY